MMPCVDLKSSCKLCFLPFTLGWEKWHSTVEQVISAIFPFLARFSFSSLTETSVGISLTCVIIVVKVVFKNDYSIRCSLSVVSELKFRTEGPVVWPV